MRESFVVAEQENEIQQDLTSSVSPKSEKVEENDSGRSKEYARWDQGSSSMKAEIWLNKGSIEGKVPKAAMEKKLKQSSDMQSR